MYKFRTLFKKSQSKLKKIKPKKKPGRPARNRFNVKKLGTVLVALGIVVALFPFLFSAFSRFALVTKKAAPPKINFPLSSPQIDRGPIKIDPALLSLKEPSEPPERIIIPGQKINLPIVEANVINGYWELSDTSASHGVGSANPGETGNIVIFAHARQGLFLNLKEVTAGDDVVILTKDRWYRYRVKELKDVYPNQIEVIAPTPDQTLTLYTCSGFLDSTRRIVVAKRLT